MNLKHHYELYISLILDSERSGDCVDFTMVFFYLLILAGRDN